MEKERCSGSFHLCCSEHLLWFYFLPLPRELSRCSGTRLKSLFQFLQERSGVMVTWQLLNGKAMYDCCHKKRRIIVPKGKEMGEISQHENTHSMRENPKGNKEIWESRETSSIIQKWVPVDLLEVVEEKCSEE